ncbi:MAG TPA: hypothetical protein VFB43_12220 [Terracidiphilus sp.]|nr:hypothetical protein [Terracidiphilus sp.]
MQAQNSSQNSSSSSSSSTPPNRVQTTSTQPAAAPYISVDPLANVRYDNKWDLSVGAGYDHMKAGPNLLQGANLGGLDFNASMWMTKHWAVEATDRTYVGTSGTAPNTLNLKGPLILEYLFAAGPEWLGPHNKHGALIAHAMAGGIYGNFEHDLLNQPPSRFGFYNSQFAPVFVIGGHMDLNRSEHWVFRITPDAVWTRYGINYGSKITQNDINFAISVGLQYKFTGIKRSHKKENWVSGW